MGRPEVLIVTGENWGGLSRLPRVLHLAGCRITTLARRGSPVTFSRYISRRLRAPSERGELVTALRDLLAREPNRYRWIILGDEPMFFAVAAERGQAWLDGWFPVDHRGHGLKLLESKNAFVQACAVANVPVPPSTVCHDIPQAVLAAERTGYPVILKGDTGSAGRRVRRVDHAGQLPDTFRAVAGARPVLVQKFIDGPVVATQVLFDHGRLICFYPSYKVQCWPTKFGPSCARQFMSHPMLETYAQRMGVMTGYHGLAGIDWIHDPSTDSIYALELNARPTPAYHLGPLAGVDFSVAIRDMLAGAPTVQRPDISPDSSMVYHFPEHVLRCIQERDWRDLKHWLPFAAIHDIAWQEPFLLMRHALRVAKELVSLLKPASVKAAPSSSGDPFPAATPAALSAFTQPSYPAQPAPTTTYPSMANSALARATTRRAKMRQRATVTP